MAMTAEQQLAVAISARIADFEKNFLKAAKSSNDNWKQIEARAEQGASRLQSSMVKATKGFSEQFRLMASSAAGALTAAFSVNQLKKYADSWTEARSKIAAAGEELANVSSRQSQLTDLAIRSRADLGATVDLYTSLKRATEGIGADQAQVLRVTETINKAFAISGASASTASGAILQLGQAFASGSLRGDELNSVLEGAPPLARLIAKEFGVSVGQLKQLGSEGKLSADKVFQALLNGSQAIEAEFAKTTPTVSQALNILNTSLTRYVGEVDQASGASATLSGALVTMAEHANITGPALAAIAAGLAAAFAGGPVAGGITAATVALAAFGSQLHPISNDLATLADYAGVAWGMIKNGATAAASDLQQRFMQAVQLIAQALSDLDFSSFLSAVKSVANAVIGTFAAAAKTIQTAWKALGIAIANSVVEAMNAVIAAAEKAANAVAGVASTASGGLFQPGKIDLGRIKSDFGEAGKVAAEGFSDAIAAAKKDYVGDLVGPVSDALAKIRAQANERAAGRQTTAPSLNDGPLTKPLKSSPATSTGSKAGTSKTDDFQREIADIEKRTRALDMEREAIGKSTLEAERAKAAFELLESAKKANVPVTDELKAKIDDLATSYANAKVKLDDAAQAQQEFKSAISEVGGALKQSFSDAIIEGERLDQVFEKLAKKLASMALNKAFDSVFSGLSSGLTGGSGGGGGLLGGLLGGIGKIFGFAEGGKITGPGGPKDDRMLAAVSNGEFVVNAKATKKFGSLLETINSNKVPKFADGGFVGGGASPFAPAAGSNVGVNVYGAPPETKIKQSQDGAGSMRIDVILRDIVLDAVKSPDGANTMRNAYGVNPSLTRRG